MKKIAPFLIVAVAAALTGCVTLEKTVKDLQSAVRPVEVRDTLQQLCQAAKDNRVRANELYTKKTLVTAGEVQSVGDSHNIGQYRVMMKPENQDKMSRIYIHASTENKLAVTQLSAGAKYSVTGIITDITNTGTSCSISLKDASF